MRVYRASLVMGLMVAIAGCVVRNSSSPTVNGGVASATLPPVRPALDRSGSADLGDLALLWDARDAMARGDLAAVRVAASALAERYPDSVWSGDLYLQGGLAARRQGDLLAARSWLADALPRLDDTGAAWRRAVVALAETSARLGDESMALRLARSLREKHPRGVADRRARRLTDRILTRHPDLRGGPDQQLAEAQLRLREGDAAAALDMAGRLIAAGSVHVARARLAQAEAERALGRTTEAEATCKVVSQTAPSGVAAEALLLAARWRWNADDDGAMLLFERARKRAPGTAAATEATYALGRIAQEAGEWARAADLYAEVGHADDVTLARAGRWGTAWVPYLARDWTAAAAAFETLATRNDSGTLAARYWQARALERSGDPRGAQTLRLLAATEADTYYGWMAGRRLGLPPPASDPVMVPPPPPFPPTLRSPHARRARALLDLGLPRLARREVDALRGTEDPELIVQAYEAIGAPEAAIRLAATLPRSATTRRYLYPLGYWDAVRDAADRQGLDPLLVQALIRQESAFAARAVSPADAYGLMQLLPRTAAEVAATRGEPAPDRVRLTEIGTNVSLGTTLLRQLLTQYDGSEIKALAAYNAGDAAVHKWERRYGDRDDDEFVELISYRETKRYVKTVIENYQVYRALYVPSAVTSNRGNPPNAPFDMMTMTSPERAEVTR